MVFRVVKRSILLSLLLAVASPGVSLAQGPAGDLAGPAKSAAKIGAENWDSLSLAGHPLKAETPVSGGKEDLPQFTRELLQVKWRTGDPIDLYVIRPKGATNPPVVLYLYTYPSETDRFRNDAFCSAATRNGFAAVGFVSALNGQRYQNRPMKEWFVSELQEALVASVHDVQMVLNYLETRGDLDISRVAMFGQGSGGTIAVLSAATDSRIKAIDVLDPWGDWPDWMAGSPIIPAPERPNFLKPEFLKKIAPLDPVQWLPQLKSQQVRVQQVMDDGATPEVAKQRIAAAAPKNAQVVEYQSTIEFYRAVSGGRLFQWMKDQILPVSTAHSKSQALPGSATKAGPGQ
ncbi:MAG TPA: alpha/beta hydrolase [Terriglobales bacterium]